MDCRQEQEPNEEVSVGKVAKAQNQADAVMIPTTFLPTKGKRRDKVAASSTSITLMQQKAQPQSQLAGKAKDSQAISNLEIAEEVAGATNAEQESQAKPLGRKRKPGRGSKKDTLAEGDQDWPNAETMQQPTKR